MKTLNSIFLSAILVSGLTAANGQSTMESEVPGDNFSLEGALELFKKSASPEQFERLLNSSDSKVNNLDLNNDGNIDYIKVIDRNEGNVHAFILQAVISDTESQDVAVIELEKLQDGKAVLQITGDADVYGIETIIEPSQEVRVNAGTTTARTVVNVWSWPSVQYVYGPYYNPWVSPWAWSYHPMWWRPWTPVAFYVYNPWWTPYRPYYSFCYSHRIGYLPILYNPYRTTSVYVYNNYRSQINHYRTHNDSRSRYDGRSGGRDRYAGYGGRTTSDYRHSDNARHTRYEANANGSRSHQYNGGSRTRQSDRRSEYTTGRSRTDIERSVNRSTDNRNSRDITQRNNANVQRERSTTIDRNSGQIQRQSSGNQIQRQSSNQHQRQTSSPNMGHQQRSSQSFGNSSGSMHSGGGRMSGGGQSSGGHSGGGSGGGHNQRGRH